MNHMNWIALLLLLVTTTSTGFAQRTFDVSPKLKYMGSPQCADLCHGKQQPNPNSWWQVRLTESNVWSEADRHSEGYRVLRGERGQRIGRLLQQDIFASKTGCVQCHVTCTENQPQDEKFVLTEGVGCEACHGPSEKWVKEHAFASWLDKTTPEERTALGMNNVRDPIIRAEICSSCHIGNAERNRLITHTMYAAGHPLLTGFEIETFTDKMPRHWQYGYEKNVPGTERFERTRKLLVASVVSLRTAIELATTDAKTPHRWPELARLDCFACHHKLDQPSWRQARGYPGEPGRAPLILGSLELARIAASLVHPQSNGDPLVAVVRELQQPFETNVFGNPEQIVTSGARVIAWCHKTEQQLVDLTLDEREVRLVLNKIATLAAEPRHDYDTARQLFGAFTVVLDELHRSDLPDMDRLVRAVRSLRQRDPFLTEPLGTPEEMRAQKKQLIEDFMPRLIKNRAAYTPLKFAEPMSRAAEWTDVE